MSIKTIFRSKKQRCSSDKEDSRRCDDDISPEELRELRKKALDLSWNCSVSPLGGFFDGSWHF